MRVLGLILVAVASAVAGGGLVIWMQSQKGWLMGSATGETETPGVHAKPENRAEGPDNLAGDFEFKLEEGEETQAGLDGRMKRLERDLIKNPQTATEQDERARNDRILRAYRAYRKGRGEEEFAYLEAHRQRVQQQTKEMRERELPFLQRLFSGTEHFEGALREENPKLTETPTGELTGRRSRYPTKYCCGGWMRWRKRTSCGTRTRWQ
jgi:hypothetical protein